MLLNNTLVRWLSFLAGINMFARGVGYLALPLLGRSISLTIQEFWPFGPASQAVVGWIWFFVGLAVTVFALLGERTPRVVRMLCRWICLWAYWSLTLAATINIVLTPERPILWGAYTTNTIVTIMYTVAIFRYGIGDELSRMRLS